MINFASLSQDDMGSTERRSLMKTDTFRTLAAMAGSQLLGSGAGMVGQRPQLGEV